MKMVVPPRLVALLSPGIPRSSPVASGLNILSLTYLPQWVEPYQMYDLNLFPLVLHHLPLRWWQVMQENYVKDFPSLSPQKYVVWFGTRADFMEVDHTVL